MGPTPLKEVDVFGPEDLQKVLEQDKITQTVAQKLLTLYVADIDWWPHVGRLYKQLRRRKSEDEARTAVRDSISFTILLPAFDRSTRIDYERPEKLLFIGSKFHQFEERDWFNELKKVVRRDQQVTEWRRQVLSLGIVDPIEYQPYTRQAYRWLCEEAEEAGVELTPDLRKKFRQLVMVYGGAVISYMFEKHRDVVKKVVNWRSGYFFERAIYNTYSLEQIIKIKQAELNKTNPEYVKTVTN